MVGNCLKKEEKMEKGNKNVLLAWHSGFSERELPWCSGRTQRGSVSQGKFFFQSFYLKY